MGLTEPKAENVKTEGTLGLCQLYTATRHGIMGSDVMASQGWGSLLILSKSAYQLQATTKDKAKSQSTVLEKKGNALPQYKLVVVVLGG